MNQLDKSLECLLFEASTTAALDPQIRSCIVQHLMEDMRSILQRASNHLLHSARYCLDVEDLQLPGCSSKGDHSLAEAPNTTVATTFVSLRDQNHVLNLSDEQRSEIIQLTDKYCEGFMAEVEENLFLENRDIQQEKTDCTGKLMASALVVSPCEIAVRQCILIRLFDRCRQTGLNSGANKRTIMLQSLRALVRFLQTWPDSTAVVFPYPKTLTTVIRYATTRHNYTELSSLVANLCAVIRRLVHHSVWDSCLHRLIRSTLHSLLHDCRTARFALPYLQTLRILTRFVQLSNGESESLLRLLSQHATLHDLESDTSLAAAWMAVVRQIYASSVQQKQYTLAARYYEVLHTFTEFPGVYPAPIEFERVRVPPQEKSDVISLPTFKPVPLETLNDSEASFAVQFRARKRANSDAAKLEIKEEANGSEEPEEPPVTQPSQSLKSKAKRPKLALCFEQTRRITAQPRRQDTDIVMVFHGTEATQRPCRPRVQRPVLKGRTDVKTKYQRLIWQLAALQLVHLNAPKPMMRRAHESCVDIRTVLL